METNVHATTARAESPKKEAPARPVVALAARVTPEAAPQYRSVLRTAVDKAEWDALVESSDTAWFYHLYHYCEIWGAWPNRSDLSFALVDPGSSKLAAIAPAFKLDDKLQRVLTWNTIDVFGGITCSPTLNDRSRRAVQDAAGGELRRLAREHRAQEIRFSVSPMTPFVRGDNCPRINPLMELGCVNTMGCAWVADLRNSKEDLWKKFGKGAKSSVNKAQKLGVTTRMGQSEQDLERYYAIHCETYRRTGVEPQPRHYFEGIWKHFLGTGRAVMFFADYQGETIAAASFVVYKKGAYYWTGCSNAAGLSTGSGALLQWTAMQWMLANGVEWYEVGEAYPWAKEGKLKQLSDFKRDFGGDLFPDFRGTLNTKNKLQSAAAALTLLKSAITG